jgi:hypothetical protein
LCRVAGRNRRERERRNEVPSTRRDRYIHMAPGKIFSLHLPPEAHEDRISPHISHHSRRILRGIQSASPRLPLPRDPRRATRSSWTRRLSRNRGGAAAILAFGACAAAQRHPGSGVISSFRRRILPQRFVREAAGGKFSGVTSHALRRGPAVRRPPTASRVAGTL